MISKNFKIFNGTLNFFNLNKCKFTSEKQHLRHLFTIVQSGEKFAKK